MKNMNMGIIDSAVPIKISWSSKLEQFHILCMEQDAIGGTIDLNDIICLSIQSKVKGNNWINDME
jgi:hypothetical protein